MGQNRHRDLTPHSPAEWPGRWDACPSSLRVNIFCSFEERRYHLNLLKCLRVKSYLLNLQSFKIYRETCYVRLKEAGPTLSQYLSESKHSLRIQGQSERMPSPIPAPDHSSPSRDCDGAHPAAPLPAPAHVGQMHVVADTRVNIKPQTNRLETGTCL